MSSLNKLNWSCVVLSAIIFCAAILGISDPSPAQTINPAQQQIPLPGSPFAANTTPDGRYVFVSMVTTQTTSDVAVIRQGKNLATLNHTIITTCGSAHGMAMSKDGRYLLVTVQEGTSCPSDGVSDGVQFIDVRKAIAGDSKAAMGTVQTDPSAIEVAISVDNRTGENRVIFVANEHAAKKQGDPDTVSAIDFKQALAFVSGKGTKPIVGTIPVDRAPVGLAVSSNGRNLYVTNVGLSGPDSCEIAGPGCLPVMNSGPMGTLSVVDIHSGNMVADIPAGCSPTRVILTNNDKVAWVSARDSDNLLAFDTSKIINDPTNALLSTTPVGIEPDGAQPFSDRRLIAVANTNRFDMCAGAVGTVSILNFDKALNVGGDAATVSTFDAEVFPRQWALSPDGKLLYLTEFGSNTLAIFPVRSIVHQIQ